MAALLFRETSAVGRNGQRGTSWSSTKANVNFFAEKDLGVLTDNILLQQRKPKAPWTTLGRALPAYQKRQSFSSSELLECWVQFWAVQYKKHGHTGVSPAKVLKDDYGVGTSDTWEEAKTTGTVQAEEEKAQGGILSTCINTEERVQRTGTQDLFCGVQWQDKRQWTQTEIEKIPYKCKKTLVFCKAG